MRPCRSTRSANTYTAISVLHSVCFTVVTTGSPAVERLVTEVRSLHRGNHRKVNQAFHVAINVLETLQMSFLVSIRETSQNGTEHIFLYRRNWFGSTLREYPKEICRRLKSLVSDL